MTDPTKLARVNDTFSAWQSHHSELRTLEERLSVELAVSKQVGTAPPEALVEEVRVKRRRCEDLLAEATAALKEAAPPAPAAASRE